MSEGTKERGSEANIPHPPLLALIDNKLPEGSCFSASQLAHSTALALKWIRQTIATVAVYHTQSLLAYFLFTANALHSLPDSNRLCGRVVTPRPVALFQMMSPLDWLRRPVGQSHNIMERVHCLV